MYNKHFKSTISIFAVCIVLVILFGIFGPYMTENSAPPSAMVNGDIQENPKVTKIKKAILAGELTVCGKLYRPASSCKSKDGKDCVWNPILIFLLKNKAAANSASHVNIGHFVLLSGQGLGETSLLTENLNRIIYTIPVRWKDFIAAGWYNFPNEIPVFFIYQTDIGVGNNYSLYALFMSSPYKFEKSSDCVIEKQLIGMTAQDALAGNFKDQDSAKIFISTQATNSRRYHNREYGKYRPVTFADGHFIVEASVAPQEIKDSAQPLPIFFGSKPSPTSNPTK